MILDIVAGMLISILSGMGIGGGGLLVIYLIFVRNMPQAEAQGLNLIFFIVASFSALIYHFKKRKINFKLSVLLIVPGIVGAIMGSRTANIINPMIIRKIFGWLLILSGVSVVFEKNKSQKKY